jgi:DNA polymerase-3 subunit alpha
MLKNEKQLLGFYVSGHPLAKYADLIRIYSTSSLLKLPALPEDQGVKLGGLIKAVKKKFSKKDGKPFAIIQLEDLEGSTECAVYGRAYEECKDRLVEDSPVFIEALTRKRDEQTPTSLGIESVIPLVDAPERHTSELHLHIFEESFPMERLDELKRILKEHPGKSSVVLCVTTAKGVSVFIETGSEYNVKVNGELLAPIHKLLGERRYKLKADKTVPQPRKRWRPPVEEGAKA